MVDFQNPVLKIVDRRGRQGPMFISKLETDLNRNVINLEGTVVKGPPG